jgi:hypothetical protein
MQLAPLLDTLNDLGAHKEAAALQRMKLTSESKSMK